MKKISAYWNYLRYGFRNRVIRPNLKYRDHTFTSDSTKIITDFLASSESTAAIAFVGLKQVKHSLGLANPFTSLLDILTEQFSTLIVPTFTASVIDTRKFDVVNTPSESGTFSQQFVEIADGRTLSPFKSFAVRGGGLKDIMALETLDDYSPNGMFEYINDHDIVNLNIGTIDIRFSSIHYLEYKAALTYLHPRRIPVEVLDSNKNKSTNEYLYLDYNTKVKFNRNKIERDLIKAGIIKRIKINDLVLRILPERKYFDFLLQCLKNDPYYLID